MNDPNVANHDTVKDLLSAYVLGSLSATERAQVEAHVRQCDECPQLLAEYEQLLGVLPLALPLETPPPDARGKIMVRVRAARVSEPAPQTWWQRFKQSLRPQRIGLAFASLAVVFALILWNVQLQQQLNHVQQTINTNGQVFVLTGTGAPEASARLYIAPGLRTGELDVSGLRPLATNRIYQLWFARPGQPTETGGAFMVDAQGHIKTNIVVPVPLNEVTAIAVTEEQAPGVLRPTNIHLLDAKP